jgi:hypothetical protein
MLAVTGCVQALADGCNRGNLVVDKGSVVVERRPLKVLRKGSAVVQ